MGDSYLRDKRNAYTLEAVVFSVRKYITIHKNSEILWDHFFELLSFDALIGEPILNPTTFTAFIFGLFGYYSGWWGMSFAPRLPLIEGGISIAMLLTIPFAGYVMYRYRKSPIIFSFLPTFLTAHFFLLGSFPIFLLVEGILAFFLLVMVVEPKTSPVIPKEQYVYGAIIGLGMPVIMRLGYTDAILLSLLIANICTARRFLFPLLFRQSHAMQSSV